MIHEEEKKIVIRMPLTSSILSNLLAIQDQLAQQKHQEKESKPSFLNPITFFQTLSENLQRSDSLNLQKKGSYQSIDIEERNKAEQFDDNLKNESLENSNEKSQASKYLNMTLYNEHYHQDWLKTSNQDNKENNNTFKYSSLNADNQNTSETRGISQNHFTPKKSTPYSPITPENDSDNANGSPAESMESGELVVSPSTKKKLLAKKHKLSKKIKKKEKNSPIQNLAFDECDPYLEDNLQRMQRYPKQTNTPFQPFLSGHQEKKPRKPYQDGKLPAGSWMCSVLTCGRINKKRDTCICCKTPRDENCPVRKFKKGVIFRKGDWFCPQCRNINYARRAFCFSCNCCRPEATYKDYQPSSRHQLVININELGEDIFEDITNSNSYEDFKF